MSKDTEDFKDIIDNEVEEQEAEAVVEEMAPNVTDPEWSEFILDKLSDRELILGNPTTDGLRRVTEKYFGEIIESNSNLENVVGNGSYAVLKHTLVIRKHSNEEAICVSACVDVSREKLPAPFNHHVVSTGCTRAEGKALRRALKIRVQTFEEMANSDEDESADSDVYINDQQREALKQLCSRANVDLQKFVTKFSNKKPKNIKQISRHEGAVMLDKLSHYQREGVPEEFEGYKKDWEAFFGGN